MDQVVGSAPLRRAAAVLDVVVASRRGLPLQVIADSVDLPLSTTHRLLQSLIAVGYVELEAESRLYTGGARLQRLLVMSSGSATLAALAEPVLRSLAEKFAQVAYITGLAGDSVELQAHVLPRAASSALVYPGNLFPVHATAAGKAIFAFQSDDVIAAKLAEPLERFQPGTIVDAPALRAELARVRESGFAVIDSELNKGVFAVACPVKVPRAGVLHAVGLVGLKEQMLSGFEIAQYVAALQEAARDFANVLSHSQPVLGENEGGLRDPAAATASRRGTSGRPSKVALPKR